MTLDDIIQMTIQSQLKQADVDAFCEQEQTTIEAFCDDFACNIAIGYITGRFSYESADSAIADLHNHFFAEGLPPFALSLYLAFDLAEYRRTQGLNGDEIARPLVKKILEDRHESAA
ncbi:MAG TPA: hypothetical protein VG167_07265 [Verrucomicrobiae bacterium]|nr:hypothetical protein [Verrucomicrobiae bacterium]